MPQSRACSLSLPAHLGLFAFVRNTVIGRVIMSTRRSGFTVVEMLVVIAIIGIIMGLTLPAVMGSRARARQLECSNNLRHLATATASFETSKQRFPGAQELLLPHDPASVPSGHPGDNKPASWFVMLLPDLGQNDAFDRWRSTRG